jgi:hypothetical protein
MSYLKASWLPIAVLLGSIFTSALIAHATILFPGGGGTGTSTAPISQISYPGSNGTYQFVATSSLSASTGIGFTGTAGALVGGSNLTITNNGVTSFNTRVGGVTLTSGDVTTALGFTPGTGTVTSVATDATLTGGPISTTGTLGINLSNANTWLGSQTFSAAITYGGVTLANSVSGTGSMLLASNPITTGTLQAPIVDGGVGVAANLALKGSTAGGVCTTGCTITFAPAAAQNGILETMTPLGTAFGTSTPYGILTVASSSANAGTFRPQLTLADLGAGANLKYWGIESNNGSLFFATSTDSYATSTLAALSINQNGQLSVPGNVGIGTSTPVSNLQIDNGGTAVQHVLNIRATVGQASEEPGILLGNDSAAGEADFAFMSATGGTSFTNSLLTFWTANSSKVLTRALTINNSQFVGIGTTSPYALLSVAGNVVVGAPTAGGTLGDLFLPHLETGAGAFLAVDPTGKVIATTTPSGASGVTSVTGSWPIISSGGTTPNITFGGLSTTTALTQGHLPYITGVNTFGDVATSSFAVSGSFGYTGTLGALVGGTGGTLSIANGGVSNVMLANSTISGISLGNSLANHSHNSTLTGTTYNGSAGVSDWGINLTNPNTWTGLQQFNGNASSTQISASGSAYFSATSGGVEIGTSTPNTKALYVTGDISGGPVTLERTNVSTNAALGTVIINARTTGTAMADGFGAAFQFGIQNYGGTDNLIANIEGIRNGADNSGELEFATDLAGTPTVNQVILANGLVGIGSTTPFAQLGVNAAAGTWPFAIGSSTGSDFSINPYGGLLTPELRPATSTTITLDWSKTGPQVNYQIGTSATTITFINATTSLYDGTRKVVWICNPGTTAGALTWAGVEWIGTAPTQTTTANQCDVYSFDITSATSTTAWKIAGTAGTGFQ